MGLAAKRQAQCHAHAVQRRAAGARPFLAKADAKLRTAPPLHLRKSELALRALDGVCRESQLRMCVVQNEGVQRDFSLRHGQPCPPCQQMPLSQLRLQLLARVALLRLAGQPLGLCSHGICGRQIAGLHTSIHVLRQLAHQVELRRSEAQFRLEAAQAVRRLADLPGHMQSGCGLGCRAPVEFGLCRLTGRGAGAQTPERQRDADFSLALTGSAAAALSLRQLQRWRRGQPASGDGLVGTRQALLSARLRSCCRPKPGGFDCLCKARRLCVRRLNGR